MNRLITFSLLLLVLPAFTQKPKPKAKTKKPLIRFDGYYRHMGSLRPGRNDTSWAYLRFYNDGKVISATSTGSPEQLKKWFTIADPTVAHGEYTIDKNQISFTNQSRQGSVEYKGTIISNTHLELEVHSLINDHRAIEDYTFIKVDE